MSPGLIELLEYELDPAVRLEIFVGLFGIDLQILLAVSVGFHTVDLDALVGQIVLDRCGTSIAELKVVQIVTPRVGVALDLDVVVGIRQHHLGGFIERPEALGSDVGARRVELDRSKAQDLVDGVG